MLISNNTPWRNLEEKNAGWDIELENKGKWIKTIRKLVYTNQNEYSLTCKHAYALAGNYQDKNKIVEAYKNLFA